MVWHSTGTCLPVEIVHYLTWCICHAGNATEAGDFQCPITFWTSILKWTNKAKKKQKIKSNKHKIDKKTEFVECNTIWTRSDNGFDWSNKKIAATFCRVRLSRPQPLYFGAHHFAIQWSCISEEQIGIYRFASSTIFLRLSRVFGSLTNKAIDTKT